MQASSAIIAGDSVMAIGGFSGSDDTMTNTTLAQLVRSNQLRFVISGGGFGGPGGFGGGGGITSTVTAACAAVPASNWGGTGTSSLYDCAGKADAIAAAPVAATVAANVPAGGNAPGAPGAPGGAGPPGGGTGGGFAQLQQCMTDKGFTLPDPSSGQAPLDQATIDALQACGFGGLGGQGGAPGAAGGPPPSN